jgi:hypothetical protein
VCLPSDFKNILEVVLSMTYERAETATFDLSNIVRGGVFRVPNISRSREPNRAPRRLSQAGRVEVSSFGHARMAWQRPWPLTAPVPIVSGALILIVPIALSHVMMSTVAHEQELGVRRLAAVYLDGISTTIYPHVVISPTPSRRYATPCGSATCLSSRAMAREAQSVPVSASRAKPLLRCAVCSPPRRWRCRRRPRPNPEQPSSAVTIPQTSEERGDRPSWFQSYVASVRRTRASNGRAAPPFVLRCRAQILCAKRHAAR